jgi:ABC-2 type transport system permease protein
MAKFLSLLKMMVKGGFNPSERSAPKAKGKALRIALIAALALSAAPSLGFYAYAVHGMTDLAIRINQPGFVFAALMAASSLPMFFFGLTYAFSSFYNARDTDRLLSMPIPPGAIVASKLAYILLGEYLVAAFFLLPPIVSFAMLAGAGPLYYAYALLCLIFSPMVPIGIASVLAIAMQRLFSSVTTEKIQALAMALATLLAVCLSFWLQSFGSMQEMQTQEEALQALYANSRLVAEAISSAYFPSLFFSRAMAESSEASGFFHFLGFAALSMGSFGLCYLFGDLFYLKAALRGNGRAARRKPGAAKAGSFRPGSRIKAIALADWRAVARTPVFFLNAASQIAVLPVLFFAIILQSGALEAIRELAPSLSSAPPFAAVAAGLILGYFISVSTMANTSFSREGRSIWLTRALPSAASEQLIGRTLLSHIFSFASCLALFLLAVLLAGLPVFFCLAACAVAFAGTFPVAFFGILVDLRRPVTEWDNPARAVKQNMNVVVCMLSSIAYHGLCAALLYVLSRAGMGALFLALEFVFVHAAFSALPAWLFLRNWQKWIMEN